MLNFLFKMCQDPFGPFIPMHFLYATFDCFIFHPRDIKSTMKFTWLPKILQTLAENLGPPPKMLPILGL